MQRWMTKALCGTLMLITTLGCFLLPVKLVTSFRNKPNAGVYIDLLNCFAGGVFFAAYLLFMAPAVREILLVNLMVPKNIDYPLPDLLIGIGFFVLVLTNKIVVSISEATGSKKGNNSETEKSNESRNQTSGNGWHQSYPTCEKTKSNKSNEIYPSENTHPSITNYQETIRINNDSAHNTNDVVYTFEFHESVSSPTQLLPNFEAASPLSRHGSIADIVHQDSMIRTIVLMLALSVDSLLEGVTTGLKTTNVEVWAIFISNVVHEAVISFCLGLQLTKVYTNTRPVVIAAVAYSLMNPVGLAVATLVFELMNTHPVMELFNGLFQALTSGCFIYVTFCEILEGHITNRMSYAKIVATFSGFAVLAAFAAVPGSSSYSTDQHIFCDTVSANISQSVSS